nr:immunoglobulin heavy chain junction region [Macaca mulatta]MOV45167.1 immunoglobulin heavy chain junction region [Macaca mulatta]MOV46013.1 immunoglobulin heavy chain junction region [Macaca mulatta]
CVREGWEGGGDYW